jgi:hypothetical protein
MCFLSVHSLRLTEHGVSRCSVSSNQPLDSYHACPVSSEHQFLFCPVQSSDASTNFFEQVSFIVKYAFKQIIYIFWTSPSNSLISEETELSEVLLPVEEECNFNVHVIFFLCKTEIAVKHCLVLFNCGQICQFILWNKILFWTLGLHCKQDFVVFYEQESFVSFSDKLSHQMCWPTCLRKSNQMERLDDPN